MTNKGVNVLRREQEKGEGRREAASSSAAPAFIIAGRRQGAAA